MGKFRTVSALQLSYYILSFAPSSQFKLQKLVYYSEGWHLAYFEYPLIDEDFEAWVHGPVVRSLWDHYKGRGNYFTNFRLRTDHAARIRNYFRQLLRPEQLELVGDVLKEYGDESAYYLEFLSHAEAPWREARNGRPRSEHRDRLSRSGATLNCSAYYWASSMNTAGKHFPKQARRHLGFMAGFRRIPVLLFPNT